LKKAAFAALVATACSAAAPAAQASSRCALLLRDIPIEAHEVSSVAAVGHLPLRDLAHGRSAGRAFHLAERNLLTADAAARLVIDDAQEARAPRSLIRAERMFLRGDRAEYRGIVARRPSELMAGVRLVNRSAKMMRPALLAVVRYCQTH
jgi:hypothetical protein